MTLPVPLRVLTAALTLLGLAPAVPAQQLPPVKAEATPAGRIKLSWPNPGEELKLDFSSDAGTRARWSPVVESPLLSGGSYSAEFDPVTKNGFWRLRRPDVVPPVFPQPTGVPSVMLGNVTFLRLSATDLSGPVTYTVEPNPLPEGAHLTADGVFAFRPVEGMAGPYTVKFTAADVWGNSSSRSVNLTVTLPPLGTPTSITGSVRDAHAADAGSFVPVVGATVTLPPQTPVVTDSLGRFTITGVPSGLQVLDFSASGADPGPNGEKYANFREHVRLIPGVANVLDRPFYLPQLDLSSQTQVEPGLPTGVVNQSLGIGINVPANAATGPGGGTYTGSLTISAVPQEFLPDKLPDELASTNLITIQPTGVTFTTPVPITFPNTDGLPPGSQTDLWSLDPKSGTFVIVGTGRVTPDGQKIETISGGVRAAEWHAVMPPQPCPENGGDDPEHHAPGTNCNGPSGSEVSVHTGGMRTAVTLPVWYTGGAGQRMRFIYNSRFAYPYIIVPYNAVNSVRAAVPNSISQEVTIGGNALGFSFAAAAAGSARSGGFAVGSRYFYDTRRLSESRDEAIRMAFGFDASQMETGYHPYRALVTSNYAFSSIGAAFNRRCTVINEIKSAYGAGWTLEGVQRVYPVQGDASRYLVTGGDGGHSLFTKGVTDRPFVVGGLSATRSGTQSFAQGTSYSGARTAIQTAYPQVSFQGVDTLTTGSLAALDILVLSPITGPTTATELTAAEQSALLTWVRSGGCVLVCVDNDLGRATFNAADESMLAPFEITSENSTGDIVFVSPENSSITSGIHGDVPRFTRAFGGRKVVSPGSWGRSIAIDPEGGIGLVEIPGGRIQNNSGQVLVVTDTQVFLNGGGGIGAADHRILLLNTIDSFLTTKEPPGENLVFRGPKGDFSRLLLKPDGGFIRRYVDGREARFNPAGQHVTTAIPGASSWFFSYDAQGLLTRITDPGGKITTFNYNGVKLTSVAAPGGRTTTFQHNVQGDLTGVLLPGGAGYSFAYDERHLMVRETTPGGFLVTREYDGCGRLVRTHWPDGTTREVSAVTSVAAPVPGGTEGTETQPVPVVRRDDVQGSFRGPAGATVARTNNFGQETDLTFPDGRRITVDRDANGLPTRTVLPTGEVFTRVFNRSGAEVERVDVLFGGREQRARDSNFQQVVSFTNAFNQSWTSELDTSGRRIKITTPGGLTANGTFNLHGALDSLKTAAQAAGYVYNRNNSCDVLSMVVGTGPEARTTALQYDESGRPVKKTDPMGGVNTYAWNSAGEMATYTTPGGRTFQFGYDGANYPVSVTPPNRPAHQIIRDSMGRVVEYRPPAGGNSVIYEHSPLGLTRVSAGAVSVGLERDAKGYLVRTVFPRGAATYTYSQGLLASAASPDGVTQTFERRGPLVTRVAFSGAVTGEVNDAYDAGRRFQSTRLNSRSAIAYTYNADSKLLTAGALSFTRSATTGRVVTAALGGVSETIGLTAFSEESDRTVRFGAGVLAGWTRTFDKQSRVLTEQEEMAGTTTSFAYTYDADGRLLAVTRNGVPWYSAAWNDNNCRTSLTSPAGTRTATFDALDRVLTDGSASFTWDDTGHVTSRSGTGAFTCAHDGLGHLTRITHGDGTVISYLLDGDSRRTAKLVNGVRTRAFLWSAFLRLRGELDGSGQVVSEFIYGLRTHMPEYMIREGVTYRLVTDLRGSVRLVVNTATGAVAQKLDYSPFGEVLADTNPGFQPFGFAGGLYDPDTGLVTFGLRTYDPSTGQWLSRDPIGFAGGDGNLYAYCGGDPVNRFDPMGLVPGGVGTAPPPDTTGVTTVFLGTTFTIGGGGGYTISIGPVIDSSGNIGFVGSWGFGPMFGLGASGTVTGQVTGGDVYGLRGPGVNAGGSGGEGFVGGMDVVSSGEGLNAQPIGLSGSLGLGVGSPVETHAFSTQTGVAAVNVPDAIDTISSYLFGP